MCGRFALISSRETLQSLFHFPETITLAPRYNIAPGFASRAPIAAICAAQTTGNLRFLDWGLIPPWAKESHIVQGTPKPQHNARAETITEKPSFKHAFKRRRCLIPADGFYEWDRTTKQAFLVQHKSKRPFMMAAIWEDWHGAQGSEIHSCAIITCAANDNLGEIHHRMPVMIAPEHYQPWLFTPETHSHALTDLLTPASGAAFEAMPISARVNKLAHDDASLWEESRGATQLNLL